MQLVIRAIVSHQKILWLCSTQNKKSNTMSNQPVPIYRFSTLGKTLFDALQEMIDEGLCSPDEAVAIRNHFEDVFSLRFFTINFVAFFAYPQGIKKKTSRANWYSMYCQGFFFVHSFITALPHFRLIFNPTKTFIIVGPWI